MNDASKTIQAVETLTGGTVRIIFTDGTTLKMSEAVYKSGSWKRGTDSRFVLK